MRVVVIVTVVMVMMMAMRTYSFEWRWGAAAVGGDTFSVFKLDGGVGDVKAVAQGAVDALEDA